jgi:succinoglycan biosynthesis protein ExoO
MQPWAILVTDRQLIPIWSGNRLRILHILGSFRQLGWGVALVALPDVAPPTQLKSLADEFICVRAPRFNGGDLEGFDPNPFRYAVNRLAARLRPIVVMAQYAWLAPALADLPRGIARWIDCHDLLHERTERFSNVGLDPWGVCSREQEVRRLAYGDLLIATQEREAALLHRLLPDKNVACLLTPIDLPAGYVPQPAEGEIVLTVGANHPGNHAVIDFAREVWPQVRQRRPEAVLYVVGGIGTQVTPAVGVRIFGRVEDLAPYYGAAKIVVCPVTIGTGVKTKLLEALRFGKAVVTTPHGDEGLPVAAERAWLTAATLPACGEAVGTLLADAEKRAALEAAAFAYARRHVALEAFRDRLAALLPVTVGVPTAGRRSVSVIVIQSGGLRELRTCISAVLYQSYPPSLIEIIAVAAPAACRSLRREFPQIVVLPRQGGDAAAWRNQGAVHAEGDIIAFLAADCRPIPTWLALATATLVEAGRTCLVCGVVEPALPRFGATAVSRYDELLLHWRGHGAAPVGCSTAVIVLERELWQRLDRFRDGDVFGFEWSGQAARQDVEIIATPGPVARRRVLRRRHALRRELQRLVGAELRAAALAGGPAPRSPMARLSGDLGAAWRHPGISWRFRFGISLVAVAAWSWTRAIRPPVIAQQQMTPVVATIAARDLPLRAITVIVPAFGWPPTLSACLASVRAQIVDLPVEIVVVVNGPEAFTAGGEALDATIVRQRERGPAAARNAGIHASSGDLVAFIDADCVAAPGWLAAGLAAIRRGATGSIVAGTITRSRSRGSWTSLYDSVTYLQQEHYVRGVGACVTANLFVHRAVFTAIGPFDTNFDEAAFEDWEWAQRARTIGIPIVYEPGAVVDHPCMLHFVEAKRKAERLARGELLMQRKLGQPGVAPPLAWRVWRQLRRAWRHRSLSRADRLRVSCIGVATAFWGWRAARQAPRHTETPGSG